MKEDYNKKNLQNLSKDELINIIARLRFYEEYFYYKKGEEKYRVSASVFIGCLMIMRWGQLKIDGHEPNPTFNSKELKNIAEANNYYFHSIKRAYHRHLDHFKEQGLNSLKKIAEVCLDKHIYQIKIPGKEILKDFLSL